MRRLFTTNRQRASGLQSPELKNPGRELFLFRRRLMIAGSLMLVAFVGLFGRFVYLQLVLHQHYQTLAESNRIAIVPIAPNRGVITDRNGVVLAQSYSGYTLEVTPSRVKNLDAMIDELARSSTSSRATANDSSGCSRNRRISRACPCVHGFPTRKSHASP